MREETAPCVRSRIRDFVPKSSRTDAASTAMNNELDDESKVTREAGRAEAKAEEDRWNYGRRAIPSRRDGGPGAAGQRCPRSPRPRRRQWPPAPAFSPRPPPSRRRRRLAPGRRRRPQRHQPTCPRQQLLPLLLILPPWPWLTNRPEGETGGWLARAWRVWRGLPLILPRRPTVALVLTVALASIGTCKATPTGKSLAVGRVRWWPPINVRVTDTDTILAAAAIESNKGYGYRHQAALGHGRDQR